MTDWETNPDDPFGHKIAVTRKTGPIEAVDPGMAKVIVAIVAMVLIPWLYPILTAVLLGTGWFLSEMLDVRMHSLRGLPLYAAIAVPCLLIFIIGMRIEQRLGTFALYRWPRFILRLLVPAGALLLAISDESGDLEALLRRTDALFGALFVMAIAAGLLFAASWVRDDWHGALRVMKLRSSKLAD